MRFIILVAPLIQLIMFGYVVTTDVNHIPIAVVDLDHTQKSRELVSLFENSEYFEILLHTEKEDKAVKLLDQGRISCLIQIPRSFSRRLKRGNTTGIQILLDGTDSNTASVIQGYVRRMLGDYSRSQMQKKTAKIKGAFFEFRPEIMGLKSASLKNQIRAWYNPELKSQNFNLPGVVAVILMITTILLTSLAIVREKEIGTIEQLIVTPIRPVELMLGKTIPFVIIGYFEVFLVVGASIFWFGIPFRGSFPLLLFATGLFLLTTLGIGLFISTVSRTQQQSLLTMVFFMMPAFLLSGFMFPIANMPKLIQYVTYLNPLRYFLIIIRDIFLKGVGIEYLWDQMLALAIIGVVILSLSVMRFRKRVE
ncbi:MAG: ABC transporter permease [Candidatus Zixiibacteriota bacterium]